SSMKAVQAGGRREQPNALRGKPRYLGLREIAFGARIPPKPATGRLPQQRILRGCKVDSVAGGHGSKATLSQNFQDLTPPVSTRLITNARIVTADEVVLGTVRLQDGRFADVQPESSRLPAAEDWEGDYLVPGLVE